MSTLFSRIMQRNIYGSFKVTFFISCKKVEGFAGCPSPSRAHDKMVFCISVTCTILCFSCTILYSVYFCRPKLVDFDIPTTVPAKQSSPFGDDFGSYTANDISTIKTPNTGRKPQIRDCLPPKLRKPQPQNPKPNRKLIIENCGKEFAWDKSSYYRNICNGSLSSLDSFDQRLFLY